MEQLEDNMISLQDYAAQKGISYEAVRSQIARYSDDKSLTDHIHKVGRTRFLDEEAVDFLDKRRSSNPVVVVSGERNQKIEDLELQIKTLTEDRDRQRNEKELYMKQLLELQSKGIDTSKYIAIEDHKKTEEELKEKETEIEQLKQDNSEKVETIDKLKDENEQLKEDSDELRRVTIRVSKLNNEIEEKRSLIDSKNNEMLELQQKILNTEAENRKIQEEKAKLEEDKKKAEEESLENLSLGFFARRKKLKELKKKNQN